MKRIVLAISMCMAIHASAWAQQRPDYYPTTYDDIVKAGKVEGVVSLYITLDTYATAPIVKDFEALYPGIKVQVTSMSSGQMHSRFISEEAAKGATADLMVSSGMDLQMQLLQDGHALAYDLPERTHLPGWASYNNLGYAITIDPVVFVYNKAYLKPEQVPKSYSEIPEVLAKNAEAYRGKIALGNVDRGGVPLLFGIIGSKIDPKYWDQFAAVGKYSVNFIAGSSDVIESVSSGENVFSINQMGAYALPIMAQNPDLAIVTPSDYTLGNSRVAFVVASSPHKNASKLLLDYILSKRGQTILMNQAKMYPVREDIDGPYTAKALMSQLGKAFHPIEMGPELLSNLDPKSRTAFIDRWKKTLTGKN